MFTKMFSWNAVRKIRSMIDYEGPARLSAPSVRLPFFVPFSPPPHVPLCGGRGALPPHCRRRRAPQNRATMRRSAAQSRAPPRSPADVEARWAAAEPERSSPASKLVRILLVVACAAAGAWAARGLLAGGADGAGAGGGQQTVEAGRSGGGSALGGAVAMTEVGGKEAAEPGGPDVGHLFRQIEDAIATVRHIRESGVSMENDSGARMSTRHLQDLAKDLVLAKYGPGPFVLRMKLAWAESMPPRDTGDEVIVELAPLELMPYSVLVVLEMAGRWNRFSGAFHRNANHVKQVSVRESRKQFGLPMPFQEYTATPGWRHEKYTLGMAGRPGGPAFYISTIDNIRNHGPGSQKKGTTEADTCFGKVLAGFDAVDRLGDMVGAEGGGRFIPKAENHVRILAFDLLPRDEARAYLP